MPRGDRTGPWGAGPMTGRSAGYCAGYGVPGQANPVGRGPGLGFARGWGGRFGGGGGCGYRHWYRATGVPGWARAGYSPFCGPTSMPPTAEQEATYLENQVSLLRDRLQAVEQRLTELRQGGETTGESHGG